MQQYSRLFVFYFIIHLNLNIEFRSFRDQIFIRTLLVITSNVNGTYLTQWSNDHSRNIDQDSVKYKGKYTVSLLSTPKYGPQINKNSLNAMQAVGFYGERNAKDKFLHNHGEVQHN